MRTLVCSGQSLAVAQHVYTALENVCPPNDSCWFAIWIDAICINQADAAEKSDQVSRMGVIYSRAARVIVWLGENALVDSRREEIESLAAYAATFEVLVKDSDIEPVSLPRLESGTQAAVISLMRSAWSTRLWIIQEVCLASTITILCGHCFIKWESLFQISHTNYHPKLTVEEAIRSRCMRAVNRCRYEYSKRNNSNLIVKEIFRKFQDLQYQRASLPIDRIYAVLFLLPDRIGQKVKVDYSLADNYWKAYVDLSRLLLLEKSGLAVLTYSNTTRKLRNLPSWCPDWGGLQYIVEGVNIPGHSGWYGSHAPVLADDCVVLLSNNHRHITIAGYLIGSLARSLRPKEAIDEDPRNDLAQWWLSWQSACLADLNSSPGYLPGPDGLLRRHVRNLLMDSFCHDGNRCSSDRIEEVDWPEVIRRYREAIKYCEKICETPGLPFPKRRPPGNTEGHDFVKSRANWRQGTYFFTDRGQVGRGLTAERPGDVLVALATAPTAFLLRYENKSKVATLIGEVYLEDFKDFETLRAEGKQLEWITIG